MIRLNLTGLLIIILLISLMISIPLAGQFMKDNPRDR